MTDKQIGKLVKEIRKEKKITAKTLARGICSESSLVYFEKGKRRLYNVLMCRIFDRIGIETDEFAFMVDEEEYEYYLWKEKTLESVEKQNWDELEVLLENKEVSIQRKYNQKIQYQYYYKLKAILEAKKKHNHKAACGYLKKAIEQTMPMILCMQWDMLCLGEEEWHLLMLYLYYASKVNWLKKEEHCVKRQFRY